MSSALAADVTAILDGVEQSIHKRVFTHKTTSRTAIAPPFPMSTAAAAGAASPALV